ncbi:Rab GDP dissociation inhibitor alpha [Schistosoma japonicum]|nr:Rab GDP dissociation inhibitor alpha [Schistosoma japonicum]
MTCSMFWLYDKRNLVIYRVHFSLTDRRKLRIEHLKHRFSGLAISCTMNEKYDVIVLGTGLKECILSSLMSMEGNKVLHIDRNSYYGGDTTSITPIESLFQWFKVTADTTKFQRGRDWNVDLISKFLMANGKLVKILVDTGVTRYLEFRSVEGIYVYHSECIHKVPCNEGEALNTKLMDLFKKRRSRKLLVWAMNVDADNPSTWNHIYPSPMDIKKDTISHAFSSFNIDKDTQDFIGHAICLFQDDSYKDSIPAIEVISRIQLYSQSVCRFGKSPYLYPLYGLGELSQAFARLSAVHGGTYMLDKEIDELVMEDGQVVGVKAGNDVAKCDMVICDPNYVPSMVRKVDQVVRAICILAHPIAEVQNSLSTQIIIPQNEVNRKHDIYISSVSHQHNVCPDGFFLVYVATIVETSFPEKELEPGLKLLGSIEQVFYYVQDVYVPIDDGRKSRVFISSSYDASPHFESTCTDVLDLYERITGHSLDFSKIKRHEELND